MNYWLHRISHLAELSYPLFDRGFLTIGFSDFAREDIIDIVLADKWGQFNQEFKKSWGSVPRTRYNLWRFLRFKKGDLVIVPSWGTFNICEVIDERPMLPSATFSKDLKTWRHKKITTTGSLLADEMGNPFDLGFARQVKLLHSNVSREKFADARLTSRMKIRHTNALINDLEKSVNQSIENYLINKPIHLHSLIIEKTARLVLDTILKELNPNKFEKLVRTYFLTIGANQVTIPAKNEKNKEGDADIVAVFEQMKLIVYTQAKFQRGKINSWGANQIQDYLTDKATIDDGYNKIAWVITTAASFNEEAERFSKENEIQLINGVEFSKMLLNAGINMLNTKL